MPIQLPPEVLTVLAALDGRTDSFRTGFVRDSISNSVKDRESLSPEARRGLWVERSAFAFSPGWSNGEGPWGTYFKPLGTETGPGDVLICYPDLREADAEVVSYWGERAKSAKHPVLVARYADLVWDTTKFVTKGKPGIEFARLAIDNYLAASRLDEGAGWGDTRGNLGRALQLALSVKDGARTAEAVKAHIDYVERTSKDDHIGTYCYLFDNLLPPDKGPKLPPDQERKIVEMFEAKFAKMTTPGGQWDVVPQSPRDVGLRLAAYYERKGKLDDRKRVIRAVAEAFERRAKMGDAMSAVFFLQDARDYFLQAGMKEEADRVQRE